jgi:hypothetical protein
MGTTMGFQVEIVEALAPTNLTTKSRGSAHSNV